MRLRTLLTLTFGLIALALAIGSTWVMRASVTDRVRDRVGDEMRGIASQIRDGLDRGMFERLRDIEVAASLDTMRDATTSTDAKRRILKRLQDTYPDYAILTYVDATGRIVATSNGLIEGADVSQRDYFLQGRKGPFAADVHDAILLAKLLGADGKDPPRFVDLAAPIVSDDGTVVGVLAAHLDWAWARDVQQTLMDPLRRRMPDADVLILAHDGTVLFGPRDLIKTKLDAGLATVARAVRREGGTVLEPWSDGVTYIAGVSPTRGYRDYKGLGWSVVVRRRAAVAFEGATRLGDQIMIGGLVSALVFALLAYWAARQVSRPLRSLAEAADRLRQGDDTAQIPVVRSYFEVDHLAQSFRALVQQLDQRRIAEATAERERAYAESANQAKSEFLASMSHEIRTPLSGILGFAGLLLDQPDLPPDVRHRVVIIQTAGQALLTVVNDVLDYSKVEAGEMALLSVPFAPVALIDNALSIVRPHADRKGLALLVEGCDDLPRYLVGDEGRLRQVLLNLINNAIKFTEAGFVRLSVSRLAAETGEDADAGPASARLRFEIADTGIGIPSDKLDRLFIRFSQVDASNGRSYGGTGLGLAISKRFVEMMGGTIGVTSEEGRGSTFWFTVELPIGTGAMSENGLGEATQPASGRPGRILIADDLAMNREMAEALLRAAGHEVESVANGQQAVQAVSERDYDLVLMDVQMPVLDGVAATRLIRAMPKAAHLPIIALTANVMPDQVTHFTAAGMNDHVGKPFTKAELMGTVERWLGRVPQAEPASATPQEALRSELVELHGPDVVEGWLSDLRNRLETGCLAADFAQRPRPNRIAEAHTLVSQAGMLGFGELSDASSAYEVSPGIPELEALVAAANQVRRELVGRGGTGDPAVQDAA